MEKMFVYPETVAFAAAAENLNEFESIRTNAKLVSSQAKRYRAVLEQCAESRTVASKVAARFSRISGPKLWAHASSRA
jgi:hypothetical protein